MATERFEIKRHLKDNTPLAFLMELAYHRAIDIFPRPDHNIECVFLDKIFVQVIEGKPYTLYCFEAQTKR